MIIIWIKTKTYLSLNYHLTKTNRIMDLFNAQKIEMKKLEKLNKRDDLILGGLIIIAAEIALKGFILINYGSMIF